MSRFRLILGLVITFLSSTSSLKLPSYIKPCSRNDPQLDECTVKAAKDAIPNFIHGDPKYGVPELDPMDIDELAIRQGTKQIGLYLKLKNIKMHGQSNADLTAARMDLKKKHIEWDFVNEKGLQLLGDYTVSGKVLILPITGEGRANITIYKLKIKYLFDFELIKKNNGKEYVNVTSSKLLVDIGGAKFKLANLFNGDRLLGDNMNQFLNDNWEELTKEFGPPVQDALGEVFRRLLTNIHSKVPFDILYPE